jgi:hypothetical protein
MLIEEKVMASVVVERWKVSWRQSGKGEGCGGCIVGSGGLRETLWCRYGKCLFGDWMEAFYACMCMEVCGGGRERWIVVLTASSVGPRFLRSLSSNCLLIQGHYLRHSLQT